MIGLLTEEKIMDTPDKTVLKAIMEIVIGLGSLIAGITLLSLGTNLYIGLGVLFLILYINSTKGE
jgi:hypothetical protein